MITNPESSMSAVALAKKEGHRSEASDQMSDVCIPKSSVFGLRSSASAFTLMEMLVVLVVIVVLVGLLFPALIGSRQRAKVTRARSEIQTLQQAWLAYGNVYGRFPAYTEMSVEAVNVLGGEISEYNPQGIAFMEFNERQRSDGFLDPWKDLYKIELDRVTPADDVEWHFTTRVHCMNTARYKY